MKKVRETDGQPSGLLAHPNGSMRELTSQHLSRPNLSQLQTQTPEDREYAFVSLASHQLRGLITAIMGFSQLLVERDVPKATRRRWTRTIYSASQDLTAVVTDMLNVSHIKLGALSVNREPVDIQRAIEDLLPQFEGDGTCRKIEARVEDKLPEVMADHHKLNEVLTNLLQNAIKYSAPNSRVTLSAYRDPQRRWVILEVTDEGIGIAPEDQRRLFAPFFRVCRPETQDVEGSGLGLYVVKLLVELMEGSIWVNSELDKGSSFYVALPEA